MGRVVAHAAAFGLLVVQYSWGFGDPAAACRVGMLSFAASISCSTHQRAVCVTHLLLRAVYACPSDLTVFLGTVWPGYGCKGAGSGLLWAREGQWHGTLAGAPTCVASHQHGETLPPPHTQIIRGKHSATKLLVFIKIKCNILFSLAPFP